MFKTQELVKSLPAYKNQKTDHDNRTSSNTQETDHNNLTPSEKKVG